MLGPPVGGINATSGLTPETLALDSPWRISSTEAVLWDVGRKCERAPVGGRAIE